ncbi:MAG: L,D-transpeptidase [Clostridium sp.]|nr:L,D-transpeptidase [Clostridium sp.]
MKRLKTSIFSVVCLILFVMTGVTVVSAAEPQNVQTENANIDTRPDYVIYVNRVLNCVTVMQKEEDGTLTPVKAMVCSCGREGHATPQGTFQTSNYYDWRLMVDRTYGRYAVSFTRQILFHSVPYIQTAPDSLEWEEYNKLGENASLGCVRLSVEDAKWIYDNCKIGTTVIVYSDSEEELPLGKPEAIKIPEDSLYRGWDPTDYDVDNPWFMEDSVILSCFDAEDGFNHVAYANRYPDLKEAFGYHKDALYEHYITYGIGEGRIATR